MVTDFSNNLRVKQGLCNHYREETSNFGKTFVHTNEEKK